MSAMALPFALLYLLMFTDGNAREEVEGFQYAGMFMFSVMAAVAAPFIAVPLWDRCRSYTYITLIFVLPTVAIIGLVCARILLSNCLDPTVAC